MRLFFTTTRVVPSFTVFFYREFHYTRFAMFLLRSPVLRGFCDVPWVVLVFFTEFWCISVLIRLQNAPRRCWTWAWTCRGWNKRCATRSAPPASRSPASTRCSRPPSRRSTTPRPATPWTTASKLHFFLSSFFSLLDDATIYRCYILRLILLLSCLRSSGSQVLMGSYLVFFGSYLFLFPWFCSSFFRSGMQRPTVGSSKTNPQIS